MILMSPISLFYRARLDIALRWSAFPLLPVSIDISRRWREEALSAVVV